MLLNDTHSVLTQWCQNRIFFAALWSWFIAQTIKVVLGIRREKRFNFRWFVGSGGMPSSHAALSAGLTTAAGFSYGFDSGLFAVAFAWMAITMFDAQGVRRQSGHQAEALNKILEDLYAHKGFQEERLKELFGHTPVEVFTGAALGVVIALLLHRH